MSRTAADMINYIKNYRYNEEYYIIHPATHHLLTLIYGFIFWMIFLPTIGSYLGALVYTNHLLIPELSLIVGVLLFSMIVGCTQEDYRQFPPDDNISLRIIKKICYRIAALFLCLILTLVCIVSGLAVSGFVTACTCHAKSTVDPRFVATVLMNLSMMFSCFRLSLCLRRVRWISLISGLGISHLLERMSIVKPEGFIAGFVVTVLISAAVMIFVSYRVSMSARVEHAGWLYFSGILLTWLATDFLIPYACLTYGKFLILLNPGGIELVLDEESYSYFQGSYYGYKFDSWNNYYQYHIYIQLGLLGICGFVIHQTQLKVKAYRGCPPWVRFDWMDARDHSFEILKNFIKIRRLLIQPITWVVNSLSSYIGTKLSALPFVKSCHNFSIKLDNFFIKLGNMCLETFIYLISNISRFSEILYDKLDLVHAFVAIVYIYIIYGVYLYLQWWLAAVYFRTIN